MVMVGGMMPGEFKSRHTVAKIKSLHQSCFNQQLDGAVDRGEITFATWQRRMDLPVGHGMRMLAQYFKDRLALTGDAFDAATELLREFRFCRRFV